MIFKKSIAWKCSMATETEIRAKNVNFLMIFWFWLVAQLSPTYPTSYAVIVVLRIEINSLINMHVF